ncbi:hypothetical protein [Streptomyces chartreusis]|uniref:hypothetical protein n=1 Tax=Streptomyces chartreusis TaxID=1969 RepID=UPI0036446366
MSGTSPGRGETTSVSQPSNVADDVAHDITESITGNGDSSTPTGTGPAATAARNAMNAIRMDFAEANQWVFYGMAIALGVGFLCAIRHPGGRAVTPKEETETEGTYEESPDQRTASRSDPRSHQADA